MKKLFCVALTILLVLSMASVAFAVTPPDPTGLDEIACQGLPSGEKLYKTEVYTAGSSQFDAFQDYMDANNIEGTLDHVWELTVWDEHLPGWIPNVDFAGTKLTISTTPGFRVLQNSSQTGGVEQVGLSASFETTSGAGLFGFVQPVQPISGNKIDCQGLPSGEQLYKYAEYGSGTSQYQMFQEYLQKNNIEGTLDHVWELKVWDEHMLDWVPNSDLAGTKLTISTTPGFRVLQNSSQTGGVEQVGLSASFETTSGAGLFGFVQPVQPISGNKIDCQGLPSGEQLYKYAEYGPDTSQYQMFKEYLQTNNIEGTLDHVWGLAIWDEHLLDWVPNSDLTGTKLTISTTPGFRVLQNSSQTGGIEQVGLSASFETTSGVGLFGFVKPAQPIAANRIDCQGLPSGEQLYKYAQYGPGTPQHQMFVDYMKANNIKGTLDHVWELKVWDEHLLDWVANSALADIQLTISTAPGFQVLHNSSLTGGTQQLGDSASFKTKDGAGLFGFVKMDAEATPTPTSVDKAPKTGDSTLDAMFLIGLAGAMATCLIVMIKHVTKANK